MTPAGHRSREAGWTLRPLPAIVGRSLRWAALLLVLFVAVYGTTNWLSAQRLDRVRLWLDWELAIPLVPGMVWVYLSLFASFFLPMFALDAPRIDALCRRLAFVTVVSGAVFLILPAELGFARLSAVPQQEGAFRVLHALDLPHNLVPSLHVSWSLVLLLSLRAVSPIWLRAALDLWLAGLLASVVLTHQHHLLDVLGGMLVALAACFAVSADGRWAVIQRRTSCTDSLYSF